jgi:type I restriction enzyme S subunit
MERYEKYKDSGVEWIGEIPVGWKVKRFRYLFDLINDKIEEDLPKIGLENIESETGVLLETNSDFDGEGIHFISGDILFGKLRPYLAKVYLSNFQGKAVGDFFVFRSKGEVYEGFGAKLILSKRFIDIVNGSTFGSKMPRVSWDFIANLRVAYPAINEQTAIANYLDRKTAEIDALIAQKQRLIELYQEEKTAIINQAVTRGIDPNAKLKASGIEWLGEIPEGWGVKKIKHILKKKKGALKTGPFGSQIRNSDLNSLGDYKVYTQRNVLDEDYISGEDRIDDEKFNSLKEFEIKTGDIQCH